MPIFEYRCNSCNSKFEVLVKSSLSKEAVVCPNCKSTENKKLFSTFAASVNSNYSSSSSCSDGSCGIPSYTGGCASGMCGLDN